MSEIRTVLGGAMRLAVVVPSFVVLFALAAQAKYGGGSGTAEEPYLVYTAEQMNTIGLHREDWDKHFKLMADIDLSAYKGDSFNLIGLDHPRDWREIAPFAGVFDGSGHTIANFTCAVSKEEPDRTLRPWAVRKIGLFRYVSGETAEVRNLGLIDPNVCRAPGFTGPISVVGVLVGELKRGAVTNCYVEGGSVSGDSCVGGLVGISYQGTISLCHVRCRVACSQMETGRLVDAGGPDGPVLLGSFGGLLGTNDGSTLAQCWTAGIVQGHYSTGGLAGRMSPYSPSGRQEELTPAVVVSCRSLAAVNGGECVGGLVGRMEGGSEISASGAAGAVSGQALVGGLVGYLRDEAEMRTSYARGSVSGHDFVGGLVGQMISRSQLSDCYATGSVSGYSRIGGLAGKAPPLSAVIKNSYAAGHIAGVSYVGGLVGEMGWNPTDPGPYVVSSFWDTQTTNQSSSNGGDAKITAEMESLWTYIAAGWDFAGEPFNGIQDIWRGCCDRPAYPRLAWEPTIAGDFSEPEGVDFRDLKVLAENWLASIGLPCQGGDLTLDACVDFRDFAVLAQWWRQGTRKTIYQAALDSAPDWQTEGQWQFGKPTGRGGEHGHPDPTQGYTGENVYGVNLDGDYKIAVDGPHYLTAGPFDCSRYHEVKLRFARWLNTDQADFVDATVEVSNDGSSWAIVWAYADTEAELTDSDWTTVVYDIEDKADYQRQVYVRWGYQVLHPGAWAFSGWNVDDISLSGYEAP